MAPKDTSYATIAEMEGDLGLSSGAQDDELSFLIDAASDRINTYCRREFAYEEGLTYDFAFIRPVVKLPRTPVAELTSITDREDSTTVDSSHYVLDSKELGRIWFKSGLPRSGWRTAGIDQDAHPELYRLRHRATYNGGYETPNQSGTSAEEELPMAIRLACRQLVTGFWRERGRDGRISREHLLEASVWYDEKLFRDKIGASLDYYRRVLFS